MEWGSGLLKWWRAEVLNLWWLLQQIVSICWKITFKILNLFVLPFIFRNKRHYKDFRITKKTGLEGSRSPAICQSRKSQLRASQRDGPPSPLQDSLFHCQTAPTVRKFFLMLSQNLLSCNLIPLGPPLLSCRKQVHSVLHMTTLQIFKDGY